MGRRLYSTKREAEPERYRERKGIDSGETRVVKKKTMRERMEKLDMSNTHLGFTWVGWFLTLFILISGQSMEAGRSILYTLSLVERAHTCRAKNCFRLPQMYQLSVLESGDLDVLFIYSFWLMQDFIISQPNPNVFAIWVIFWLAI